MIVTNKMISAAHKVTMEHGDIVLSHRLLTKIYLAMDALANQEKTSGSPSDSPCTCHPEDNPPVPCAKQYAFSECKKKGSA